MKWTLTFGALLLLVIHSPGGETKCGTLINRACQWEGCSPHVPTDTACSCNAQGTNCNCVNSSGALQQDEWTTCSQGNWDYGDPEQYYIKFADAPTLCMTVQRCTTVGGSNYNCGVYDQQRHFCVSVPGACSWRTSSSFDAYEFVTDGLCE
jgi:hypothetical protein